MAKYTQAKHGAQSNRRSELPSSMPKTSNISFNEEDAKVGEEEEKMEAVAEIDFVGREVSPLKGVPEADVHTSSGQKPSREIKPKFVAGKETCEIGCGPDLNVA